MTHKLVSKDLVIFQSKEYTELTIYGTKNTLKAVREKIKQHG